MERTKLGKFDVTILDPKIIVFHNVIENGKELIDHYEKEWPWRGWFGFGRQVDEQGPYLHHDEPEFPSYEVWKRVMIDTIPERPIRQNVAEQFYWATKEYVDYTDTKLPNWVCKNWTLARYIPDEDVINNKDLNMNYHTDYQSQQSDWPGEKFTITAVIYPNDDYDGGEIAFRVSDENYDVIKQIEYKPVAGDVVIFPAGPPYYHGVKRIWNKAKYIIRVYWQCITEATPEFEALKEKYGEKFQEMERERISRHDLMEPEPVLRPMYSMTEYYERLENGTLPDPGWRSGPRE